MLGFCYILLYYERTANFHKGTERDRETDRQRQRIQKQERRGAWGCECQIKATKEWRFLSSENAASKERRLHLETVVTPGVGESPAPFGPWLCPDGETSGGKEEVVWAGPR